MIAAHGFGGRGTGDLTTNVDRPLACRAVERHPLTYNVAHGASSEIASLSSQKSVNRSEEVPWAKSHCWSAARPTLK